MRKSFSARALGICSITLFTLFFGSYTSFSQCNSGTLGGQIYLDANNNGSWDQGEAVHSGLLVRAFDASGTWVGQAVSNALGQFTITGLTDGNNYRLEYTLGNNYLVSNIGTGNGGDVQFASAPFCDSDLGLMSSNGSCSGSTEVFLSCFVNGLGANSPNQETIIGLVNSFNAGSPVNVYAKQSETGAVWGIVYNDGTQEIFSSAFVKQHASLGPGGLGAIYKTNTNGPSTSLFANLTSLGINVGSLTTTNSDNCAYGNQVGKVGLGGLTTDPGNNFLYVANLNTNSVVQLSATNPTAATTTSYQVPDPGCNNGDYRIFGLKYHGSSVYVGVTCTGETSGNEGDTEIHVYEMNAASGAFSLVFSSSYSRGFWSSANVANRQTMQWLTDIDFTDNGNMILALSDRLGHAFCNGGSSRVDDQYGDILIVENVNGNWVLENNGSISSATGTGVGNGEGPGGGEFFGDDFFPGNPTDHPDVALGSIYVRPGSDEVISTVFDPGFAAYSGGLHRYNTTSGQKVGSRELYNQNIADYFGKATGFGDVHAGCGPSSPQIGNYVWIDTDCDGMQDAGEPALAFTDIFLYDSSCNLISTTQTDAQGNYSFSSGISVGTQYFVALDPNAFSSSISAYNFNGIVYNPTVANNSAGLNSDLQYSQNCPSLNGVPVISVIPNGSNNITFDIGLKPSTEFDLACMKINKTPGKNKFGDIIEFEIQIYNQGSVTATSFEIVDYLTSAYQFDPALNPGWVLTNGMAKKMINTPLLPGQAQYESIFLELVGSNNLADFVNYAEISYTMDVNGVQNSDVDSTTDDNSNNDAGGVVASSTDDMINGVGVIDEDDHDPAMIYIFDLALSKVNRNLRAYDSGETVVFDITVCNQGNVDATSFQIADNYPVGLIFNGGSNPGWTSAGSQLVTYNYNQTLAIGAKVTIPISFTIAQTITQQELMNYAEISNFTSAFPGIVNDFDSQPDTDMTNDVGGVPQGATDNLISDHGVIDEDDHDPASVSIRAVDLALVKRVSQTSYNLGDQVTFEVEVFNQGTTPIGRIQLVDFMPANTTLMDNSWTLDASGTMATKDVNFLSPLAPGQSYVDYIVLEINPNAPTGAFLNYAEISKVWDIQNFDVSSSDIDSNPDAVMGNDAGGMPVSAMDDYILGNGNDDEDDSDPALVFVPTIELSEACACLRSATSAHDGQFREEIKITSISGENWYIDFEFEFYNTTSTPGNNISYPTGPTGKQFIERPNGDGTSCYILKGKSVDDNQYTLRATNGWGVYLSVDGGDCDYCTPLVESEGLGAVCANSTHTYSVDTTDPKYDDCIGFSWFLSGGPGAGTIVNMPGTNATGSGTGMTGSGTGPGNSITIDWGTGTGPHELILIPHCPNDCVSPVNLAISVGMDDEAMACVHELNISLDDGCKSILYAEDLLTSPVSPGVAYQLIITDAYGNVVQGNKLTEEHLWTRLMAKVMNPCSGNSCWAFINVEDKLPPQIQCDDIEVKCYQMHNYEPLVLDNCSTSEYRLVSETTTPLPCTADYIKEIYRTYVAEDGYGNVSPPCTQKINVLPVDLDAIDIPINYTIADENALSCMGLELDDQGHPHPNTTGVPSIDGLAIYPITDLYCNMGVDYRDVVVVDFGCSKKIMRTWTVYDGCKDPLRRVQTIEIADTRAPWVDCPANVTINTDGTPGCDSEYTIPMPQITDDCTVDNFIVDIKYAGGFLQNVNGAQAVILSAADDTGITYNVYDECGNESTCTYQVTVVDNVTPTAVCDRNSVVSLRLDGTAKAFPQTFDDGSYDDCDLFKTLVRRMDSPCECERPRYDDMSYLGERNGRFYYLSSFERPCFKAFSYSTAYGGALLTLESQGEHDWVYEQVNNYLPGTNYYIGLKDKHGNGAFTWDSHAEPNFNVWSGGSPTADGECVVVNEDGEWQVVGDIQARFVLEVANPCGFSEEVSFCCADVGNPTMVVLRAIDYFGGYNDCMVNIEVQDKVPPVLTCPDNLVLDCSDAIDLNNLSQYGDATASDRCIVNISSEVIDSRTQCGTGTIIRRFTAADASGTSTCDQVFDFVNDAPFDFTSILMPLDFDTDLGCNFGALHPDNLPAENAYPIYPTDACDIVEGTYEDQVFSFAGVGSDACLKILRKWTVIDWCQLDADGLPRTEQFDQTIKVMNTEGPEIVSGQCDTLIISTLECDNGEVNFSVEAHDDCTPDAQLQNCVRIDINSDGTFDLEDCLVSNVVTFNNKLPLGHHTALISFSDLCGNTTTCSKEIWIKNEKPPIAYCKSGLSVALEPMDLDGDGTPDDEMACIFPHMLDLGSEHPCGSNFGISFCNNDPTNKITFDCTDIGTQIVTLCVIDEFGNSASCQTTVEVQDNNDGDFCPEFDLAIIKEVVGGGNTPFNPGDTVKYRITVFNQGNIDAIDTRLIDYIPAGLQFIPGLNPGWTGPDINGDVNYTTMPTIPANPFGLPGINPYEIACIYLRIDPNTMLTCLQNEVEISSSGNPNFPTYHDLDSHADNIVGNDFVKDNVITEDGYNNSDQDEDDHDIAKVDVRQTYDLALTKDVTGGNASPYNPGDNISFTITITNQGTLDATTVDVQDDIPVGLILNDNNWSIIGGNAILNNSIPFIGAGSSQSVTINFTIDPSFMGSQILNDAQIIDRDGSDLADIDSNTATDKNVDEDGDGDGDDDDEDWEMISLDQTFDLALRKVITPGGPAVYQTGDLVSFDITVFNQGTLDASNVVVTDYVRANMIYNQSFGSNTANGWSLGPNPTNTIGSVAAGSSQTVTVQLMIDPNFTGAMILNDAEITNAANALGLPDEDSSPNDNSGTPSETGTDNDIGDAPDNPNDNDDYDPAEVMVECVLEPICNVIPALPVRLDDNGTATVTAADIDLGSSARCDGLDVTLSLSKTTFTCVDKGVGAQNVIVVTVTDSQGNQSDDPNCFTQVTVLDEIDPFITCQGITTTLDGNGDPIINLNQVVLTSGDNCGIANTVLTPPTNVNRCIANNATVTVTDICGNTATCTFQVSIADEPPVARCAANFDLCLDASGSASITAAMIDDGSTDDCAIAQLAINQMNFDCNDVGPNTIMLSVFDNNAVPQTDQCTTVVTVIDKTPPLAICQSITVEVGANGTVGISALQIDNGSNDSCGLANNPFALSDNSFSCTDKSMTNTTTLTVTDANGNTASCNATVNVVDNIDPTITCRSVNFVNLDANGQFTIDPSFVITSSGDNCTGFNSVIDRTTFSCADKANGVVVTATVTDASGNRATCQTDVTVRDLIAPSCTLLTGQVFNVVGAPPVVTVELDDIFESFTDNCANTPSNVSISPNGFSCANLGLNTVTVTMEDDCGNTTTCSTQITVQDVNEPTCEVMPDVTLDLGANGMVTITPEDINISSTAGCDPNATLTVTPNSLACNQIPLSPICVTLTVTASNGNSATCKSNVTVQDVTPPTAVCTNDLVLQLGTTGNVTINADDIITSTADNCPGETRTIDITSFDCADKPGPVIVTATVTDESGNSSTCTTSVTLEDNVAPECTLATGLSFDLIGTPPSITITADDVLATYSDNCGSTAASATVMPATFGCADVGPQTVVVTVTDNCGNTNTCSTSINIADTSVPTCIAQNVTVCLDSMGMYMLTAAEVDNGSNAGCGTNVDLSVSPSSFDCGDLGMQTVTLTVTTSGGNSSTCTAVVTVEDKIDPTITCPIDVTVACGDPLLMDLDNFGVATADDNCPNNLGTLFETTTESLNACGIGTITRLFRVSEDGEFFDCTQIVTINQIPAFGDNNITCPPASVTIDGCVDLGNIYAGSPVINIGNLNCVMISVDSTLVDLSPQTSGTCIDTFLKTWTILDECTGNTFICEQNIILDDGEGPVINCMDVEVFLPPNFMACEMFVDLPVTIVDSCSMNPTGTNNSPFANNNNVANAAGTYPGGQTNVTITAEDQCGNVSTCEYAVTVIDTTANLASCKKIIETIQPPMGGSPPMGIVDTSQACVVIDSNCPANIYSLSFDPNDPNVVTFTVDCADAANPGGIVPGGYTVYLWIGNILLDSCSNFLQVLDGAGHCTSPAQGEIVGKVFTEDDRMIPEVMVELEGSNMNGYMTDDYGHYVFGDVAFGSDYIIVPEKDKEHLNGVSTLDLVMIQRHVLGLEHLDSPYKLIAADINKSGGINGIDLVELRKMILGLYTEFPNNTSWRMIDAGHEFFDPLDPFYSRIPESYTIIDLEGQMEVDFVGVKVGDVNETAITNVGDADLTLRSSSSFEFIVSEEKHIEGDIVELPIKVSDYESLEGFQFTLEVNPYVAQIIDISSSLESFTEANYNMNESDKGLVHMSWNDAKKKESQSQNTEIFTLRVKLLEDAISSDIISIYEDGIAPEAYMERVAHPVSFDYQDVYENDAVELFQNSPNPWSMYTEITYYMPAKDEITMKIYDVDGKLIRQLRQEATAGNNTIILDKEDLSTGGIYYYELITSETILVEKMILIK